MSLAPPLRRAAKAGRLGWHLLRGAAIAATVYPRLSGRARVAVKKRWSRRLLGILGIRIELLGRIRDGSLVVANHVSWVDVFVLNATAPAAFVAKAEVRNWPFIGWLAAQADTLFIERGRRRHAQQTAEAMAELLGDDRRVAFFPEGTTSDGSTVLAFHSALFQAAIDVAARVQPVAIRYVDAAGQAVPEMAYVGDTSFLQSLAAILCADGVRVEITCPAAIDAAGKDRRHLAAESRRRIVAALAQERREATTPIRLAA